MNLPIDPLEPTALLGLCVAAGIGLIVGAERERRKGRGPTRAAAGVRTFAVASLLGAVGLLAGGVTVLAVVTLVVGAMALLAYHRNRPNDPGMTTELALVLTSLLGGLAMHAPVLAGGMGAALAGLLAARDPIHHFVRGVLSERELHDALLFAAAALIVLPLAPDRFMGPFLAINPYAVASLIVLVMGVSALGYVATRVLGPRYGLALAGLAGGFISSTATIHAMGVRAAEQPALAAAATAGAVLSSVATIILLGVVVAVVAPALLTPLALPLIGGGIAAVAYGALLMTFGGWHAADRVSTKTTEAAADLGRAFNLKEAFIFAAVVSVVLLIAAGLHAWLGARGLAVAAAVTGLADAHATAASAAALVAAGKLEVQSAVWPILLGLSSNTLAKAVVAFNAGGAAYAARIVPGLVLMLAGVWLGVWLDEWLAAS